MAESRPRVIDPASPSTLPSGTSAPLPAKTCAVLRLDAAGVVRSTNVSARKLWRAPTSLAGETFVALFSLEVVSRDTDFLTAQWEVLLAEPGREWELTLLARDGTTTAVRVQLEAEEDREGHIATVIPAQSGAASEETALELLTRRGAAGFFDLHLATGQVYFSSTWKQLLGYGPTELPESMETWRRLIHPEDSAAAPDQLPRKLAQAGSVGARTFSVEFRLQHRRGHWVWIQCTGVQRINAEGALERVVGVTLDVTERKELEDSLVGADARLHDLAGEGPLAVFEIDFPAKQFWFSPAWDRLLGCVEGAFPPETAALAAAFPAAGDNVEAWLTELVPDQSTFVVPTLIRALDGSTQPVLLGVHRVLSRRRELQRVVGFVVSAPGPRSSPGPDGLLQTAWNTLAEAVLVTDPAGRILFGNTAAARVLHQPAEQLAGRPLTDVLTLLDRHSQEPVADPVTRALAADQPLPLIRDHLLAIPGKATIPVVWTARSGPAVNGAPSGVALVFRNPEEITLSPDELVRANRFEALGLLAGGIAHDFNNLLTTILGAVSLAKDSRDYSALEDAEAACLNAKGLTRQLLSFAKGGSGTESVFPPKELLTDSVRIAAAASSAEILFEVEPDAAPIQADRAQLLQVFQNLIVNALQAMPPEPHRPRIHLRARNVSLESGQIEGLPAGAYVEFEVRDNGSGIKPEYVAKIFDPFFTTKKHGTGLGLATVLSIVRKQRGQIALDTQLGVGTVFSVYLPQATRAVEVQARRAASLRFGTGRILFMDDDPKIAALTGTMLQSLDYRFDLAKDGDEAIALYKRYLNIGRPYDVVILDLTIVGGMGGERCFEALRALDPEVRAIVASGYDNQDTAREFLAKGFCGYLTKPYRVTDLGKVLKTVLG